MERIKKENPRLNAYLSIFGKEPDTNTRMGTNFTNEKLETSLLAGIPCAVKDNILIEGEQCTAASKILENYVAPYDATVVTKLKQTGAVFLGKTNLDEFAMGATGEKSAFGPTFNPHDHSRVAGGSSAGSGAAVAADLAVYALGSDTGGSIRAPAAWCGVVGLKPTYGLVSRYGLIAMASSLDQIGPITKTVEDAAIVLNAIAGHDPMDSTSHKRELPDYAAKLNQPIKGMKVGVPKEFMGKGLDPEVNNFVQKTISKLESLGAHIDQVSLPMAEYAVASYYIIVPSEISANLARYDGIRYGLSAARIKNQESRIKNLLDVYLETRAEGLGDEVKRRIMLGAYALSAGYYDAYYLKAQKVRALIKQDFDNIFEKFDAIVGPTMPTAAPKLSELDDPLAGYLADIYTCPINLAGLPAISIPCGFVKPTLNSQPSTINRKSKDKNRKPKVETRELEVELPVGFQIIGKQFGEEAILRIAYNLEQSIATNE